MCNAWNHSSGCACGFGEPSSGVAHVAGRSGWPEDVQSEPRLLKRGLRELGWASGEIERFADLSLDTAPMAGDGIAQRVRRNLLGYKLEVLDERTETVHVPVFRFSAPRIARAQVVYRESETNAAGLQFLLKVFGVGTGDSTDLEVERLNQYVADAGECKVVVIPLRMHIARVRTLRRGNKVGEGIRAEVIVPKAGPRQMLRERGCRTIRRSLCREQGGGEPDEEVAQDLSGDASGALHEVTRRWAVDYTHEVDLAFKGTVSLGPLVRSTRKSEVVISLRLPSGHSYRASIFRDRLWWESPTI